MRRILILLYRKAAPILRGTGISQRFPLNLIEKLFLSAVRSNTANIEGHTLHLDPTDSLNLSVLGDFEPFETETIKKLVHRGDVAVDVGANIGFHTLLLARLVGPEGIVYAFEPDPDNFALLQKNIQANGYQNVVAEQAAVSHETGSAQLFLASENHVDHRLYHTGEARAAIDVRCYRLDDYFPANNDRVDFLKMDIQGAEVGAIRGMENLLKRNENIKVITEFWPFGLETAGDSPVAFLDLMSGLVFEAFEVSESKQTIDPVDPAVLLAELTFANRKFTNLLYKRP